MEPVTEEQIKRFWSKVNKLEGLGPDGVNRHKISGQTVVAIREQYASGTSVRDLVAEYGVSASQVYNIINNRQRKEV